MNKICCDLIIKSSANGGYVVPMADGTHRHLASISLVPYDETNYVLYGSNKAVYRIQKSDVLRPPMARFIKVNSLREVIG